MRDTSAMTMRLPRDVRDWLKAEAERNLTSISAEIVRAVRNEMDRQTREIKYTKGGE